MKKIPILILICCLGKDLIGQPPIKRAGSANTVEDYNLFALRSFRPPVYVDTAVANMAITLDSCGKIIFTYDGNKLWKRQCNPKVWVEIGSGGGGSTDTALIRTIVSDSLAKNLYGSFFNMSAPTVFPADLFAPSAFYSISGGGLNFTGGSHYWDKYIRTDSSSASGNYKETIEFTLTTKPASDAEGLFVGKQSVNGSSHQDIAARVIRTDANNWTIKLYSMVDLSTITEVATVPFALTIPMTEGQKYRIELTYQTPFVNVKFSMVDSTATGYSDILYTTGLTYQYKTPLMGVNMPNTGGYDFGALGATNNYRVTKFNTSLYHVIGADVAIMTHSIGQGYNATNPNNYWVNRLFLNSNLTYEVFAGQSDKTADGLLRTDEIINTAPKYAIINLDWNDVGASVPTATFEANTTTIINRFKAANIVPILLKTIPPSIYLDSCYYKVAKATNVKLIDLGYQLIGYYNFDGVSIHPNDVGMELIANFARTSLPEVFAKSKVNDYEKKNQYILMPISSNTTTDEFTGIYEVDATGGDTYVNIATTDASMVGRQIQVIKKDNSSNNVICYFYGGATVNGGVSVRTNVQYDRIVLTCMTATTWVAQLYKPGQTVLPLDTTTYKIGVYNAAGDVYKMNWPTGGTNIGNSDLTQTSATRTYSGGNQDLVFNGGGSASDLNVEYGSIVLTGLNSGINIQGDSIIIHPENGKIYIDTLSPSTDPLDSVVLITPNGKLKQKAQSDLVWALTQSFRLGTSATRTTDVTLSNVTGFSANLLNGATYTFEAKLYTTSNVAGGVNYAIGGTATASSIIYEGLTTDAGLTTQSRAAAMATSVGNVTAVTAAYTVITGTIVCSATGSLTLQFAQNASNAATSTILAGSTFIVTRIN